MRRSSQEACTPCSTPIFRSDVLLLKFCRADQSPIRKRRTQISGLKRIAILLVTLGLLSTLVACKGDPAVKKQKYLESGNRYLDKKQFKEATIQYQNAIQIDPQFATAHYKLSQAYMGSGNWRGAFTELKKTVEIKPDDIQAQTDLGNFYVAGGNWFEAEQIANLILGKDPNNADAHALLSNINPGRRSSLRPR